MSSRLLGLICLLVLDLMNHCFDCSPACSSAVMNNFCEPSHVDAAPLWWQASCYWGDGRRVISWQLCPPTLLLHSKMRALVLRASTDLGPWLLIRCSGVGGSHSSSQISSMVLKLSFFKAAPERESFYLVQIWCGDVWWYQGSDEGKLKAVLCLFYRNHKKYESGEKWQLLISIFQ